MKKWILLLISMCVASSFCHAQDDDVYFVPSGSKQEPVKKVAPARYAPIAPEENASEDWSAGRVSGRDVDDYNRRGMSARKDTLPAAEADVLDAEQGGTYTARLVRFHSPRVGVYVSSPFYVDYYDYWYDPWYDSWAYGYWPGFHVGWWPGWGWRPYWNSWWGWHRPWWDYTWGWHYPVWGAPSWSVSQRPSRPMAAGRVTSYRPSRDYAASRVNGGNTNRNNSGNRPSRTYGNGTNSRPSRTYGNGTTGRPSRNFGTQGTSGRDNTLPSRSGSRTFGNSSNQSNRSYSAPSNGSSGRTFGTGAGSGRSFGGGGRSSGGRR